MYKFAKAIISLIIFMGICTFTFPEAYGYMIAIYSMVMYLFIEKASEDL